MTQLGRDRIVTIFAFLLLALAAAAIVLIPTPKEPWGGLYEPYASAWALLIGSAVLILWRVQRGGLSWNRLVAWGLLFTVTIGAFSLQWGWVYGHHDPWAHYGNIQFQVFNTRLNPYPAFHIWNIQVGEIIGVPGTTVLRYSAVLAAGVGALGLGLVLRTLPIDRYGSQYAFVAGIPAVFLSFTPRPFTLGWPFVMIIAWAVFTPLARRQALALLVFLGVGLTAIHPQVPFLASAFLLAAFLVQFVGPRLPRSFQGTDIPFAARQFASLIAIFAITVSLYFFVLSDFGERVVDRLLETASNGEDSVNAGDSELSSTPTPDSAQSSDGQAGGSNPSSTPTPDSTQPSSSGGQAGGSDPTGNDGSSQNIPKASGVERRASKVSQLGKVAQNPSLITELLARLSYGIVLGAAVTVSVIEHLRKRQIANVAMIVFVSAGLYGAFYLFADLVLNNALVGSMRIVRMLPLVLIPGIAFALRRRSGRIQHVGTVLALMILISGIAVAYPSDFTGATVKAATDTQVAGVDWIGTYGHNQSVTGTGMTFWILEGRFGKSKILELAPSGSGPPKVYVTRRVGFSWQVRDPASLIVVDEFARAQARQEVAESGDRTPLKDLETMPIRHSRLYANGGTNIYGNQTVAGG